MRPDDDALTKNGLPAATGGGKVLVLACGALAHEILALNRLNGWDHVTLSCLPAILHNAPEKIPAAVEAALIEQTGRFDKTYLAYADCGTGGALGKLCERFGIEMIKGPHCYAFFDGVEQFTGRAEDEITSFYLTDFLARQFEAFVIKPLGLDRHPELREAYFGHYEKLVYLAQTESDALNAKAERAAGTLGLAYERRFTGYGELATTLEQWLT
jgi:hypothetical protein